MTFKLHEFRFEEEACFSNLEEALEAVRSLLVKEAKYYWGTAQELSQYVERPEEILQRALPSVQEGSALPSGKFEEGKG